ncbi:phytanoyl-CoA dioxygenase family protein [Rhizobium changzhiense]|uniref:phytanoyl-CoA dioxygenase family protein n=1 Tax=Rhizobium changzhiense TaxID=2692317 RepID=UPI001F0C9AFD|nr:phytanoyl-CoA dioxygenase family protein [Rhizobium changzhiense]MCH4544435.1 phytanoyl-CoA dioxygenase family protein [Rhizobium changzhiense]
MMLSIRNGIDARNYWRSVLKSQQEHALPVKADELSAYLMSVRSDSADIVKRIASDGVVVVEDYWSAEQCAKAVTEMDKVIETYPDCVRQFSGGADRRMFGVEMVSETARLFHEDKYLRSMGEFIGGRGLYNFATLGARIDATDTNRGSGDGWHRDAFGFQFKAIIYLCDVTPENGPFEYIPRSHKEWRVVMDSALGRLPAPPESRIDDARVQKMITSGAASSKTFMGKAGTLVLANTTGVHRGTPLLRGRRYALTNYYYHHFQIGDTMLQKFAPMMPGTAERIADMIAG